ncbi:MAG: MBL fold metallo-hydrolase [Opitutus sp.]|nr:MBL fold metallo-hydrolase [Opitutus sp.]
MPQTTPGLEDELGDVLEKAARQAALTYEQIAAAADIDIGRIKDAIDYRPDLTPAEIRRLAQVLDLNEVGLAALAQNAYPRPPIGGLPFCLFPLHMPFGIGVANAYIVSSGCDDSGVLFDTGASGAELLRAWPARLRRLAAVFVTHYEAEHIGGLEEVMEKFGLNHFYGPLTGRWSRCLGLGEGQCVEVGGLAITALLTPGHAAEHNCYLVAAANQPGQRELLVSGDLIFAGSLGGGYFCCQRQLKHARRVLQRLPDDALIAPGHGPLSTAGNERRFNPFFV